jgi:hypothetical protein
MNNNNPYSRKQAIDTANRILDAGPLSPFRLFDMCRTIVQYEPLRDDPFANVRRYLREHHLSISKVLTWLSEHGIHCEAEMLSQVMLPLIPTVEQIDANMDALKARFKQ